MYIQICSGSDEIKVEERDEIKKRNHVRINGVGEQFYDDIMVIVEKYGNDVVIVTRWLGEAVSLNFINLEITFTNKKKKLYSLIIIALKQFSSFISIFMTFMIILYNSSWMGWII